MQPTIFTLWVILSTIAGEPVILPVRDPEAWPIDQNMRQFLEHPERFFVPQAERLLCRQILDGDLVGVQTSVADGASVDAIGRHGVTPLFWAYFARKYKIYQYLLEQGASPDVVVTLPYQDFRGDDVWRYCENDSVLMMTVRNQYIEDWLTLTLQYLKPRHWIQQHGNTDVLHTYVNCYSRPTGHSSETLAMLIRLSLDLNEQTKDGSTALMLAVEQLNYSCAVQLVQAGAGLTCYDAYHRQLIHIMAGNIRDLAQRLGMTQRRIRECRRAGLGNPHAVRDWLEAITGHDPGPRPEVAYVQRWELPLTCRCGRHLLLGDGVWRVYRHSWCSIDCFLIDRPELFRQSR